jgi:deoxyribonucleoside regulator
MDLGNQSLIIQICRMYYEQKMTQQEIAELLQMSRTKIVRLIQEGHELGIVQIRVIDPSESTYQDLSKRLISLFPLKILEIVPNSDPESPLLYKNLAKRALRVFMNYIGPNKKIGIGWGKSIYAFINEFSDENLTFLQPSWIPMIGGLGEAEQYFQVNELIRELQRKLGGISHSLHAPALVESQKIKETLFTDSGIQSVIKKWQEIDIAIFGIGSIKSRKPSHPPLLHIKYLPDEDRREILRSNAVGDILSRFFDKHGQQCDFESNPRIIGISLGQLANIPLTLAIAGGEHKAEAILGALRGGYLNGLITDESAVKKIINLI